MTLHVTLRSSGFGSFDAVPGLGSEGLWGLAAAYVEVLSRLGILLLGEGPEKLQIQLRRSLVLVHSSIP